VNDANLQNAVSFAILAERMRMSLMSTDDQIKALERLRQLGVSSLDLEVERQHILQSEYRSSAQAASEALNRNAQTLLAMGGAGNGVRAFFTEMDAESKNWAVSLGREVHDALNGAFESISQNIAKLATGQKTDFGKSFQSVGQHMVEGSTKNAMEKGIGALGSIFHNEGLGKGKPDGTKDNAYWVKFADDWLPAGDGSTDNAKGKIQKSIFGALTPHHYEGEDDDDDDDDDDDEEDKGKDGSAVGFWSKLGKGLLGALIPHAGGGDISPASAYLVGERGPEILTGMAGRITNNVDSMRALKAPSAGIYYSIDARGADSALADQNVRRALVAVHGSAVATSVQAMNELAKRRPQG